MTDLIQTRSVVDIIIARRSCSEGYARLMVFKAVKSGKLKPYSKQLKYGSRSINLYNPTDVILWLDQAKQNKKSTVDKV